MVSLVLPQNIKRAMVWFPIFEVREVHCHMAIWYLSPPSFLFQAHLRKSAEASNLKVEKHTQIHKDSRCPCFSVTVNGSVSAYLTIWMICSTILIGSFLSFLTCWLDVRIEYRTSKGYGTTIEVRRMYCFDSMSSVSLFTLTLIETAQDGDLDLSNMCCTQLRDEPRADLPKVALRKTTDWRWLWGDPQVLVVFDVLERVWTSKGLLKICENRGPTGCNLIYPYKDFELDRS